MVGKDFDNWFEVFKYGFSVLLFSVIVMFTIIYCGFFLLSNFFVLLFFLGQPIKVNFLTVLAGLTGWIGLPLLYVVLYKLQEFILQNNNLRLGEL